MICKLYMWKTITITDGKSKKSCLNWRLYCVQGLRTQYYNFVGSTQLIDTFNAISVKILAIFSEISQFRSPRSRPWDEDLWASDLLKKHSQNKLIQKWISRLGRRGKQAKVWFQPDPSSRKYRSATYTPKIPPLRKNKLGFHTHAPVSNSPRSA